MAAHKVIRRAAPPLALMMMFALLPATGSAQTTRAQVDAACEDSREQLAAYRAARTEFEDAAMAYERVLVEIDRLERQQARVSNSVEMHSQTYESVQRQIEQHAVELYMRGGFTSPGIILSASSVDKLLTTTEFLSTAGMGGRESLSNLLATRGELERFERELDGVHLELTEAEELASEVMGRQHDAMLAEQAAHSRLSERCRDLNARFEAEQRARREAELRRQQLARQGSVQTGPFICPFTPGRTSFIDSWGFPRSGGRRHQGTDLFAVMNEPMFAVQSGTVLNTNSRLGGIGIWLRADTGIAYYYAHLSSRAVGNGQRVSQGQVIGYNGNTGNAYGGTPHLHFQMHPGGLGTPAVNPYPTLAAACKR
jgi:peptidoglycan LD-endopeptidase LytH